MQARWVVMGPSGCGKSTVAAALARRLNVPFIEGDSFHPPANVAKMSSGVPLTDADRAGWLAAVRDELSRQIAAHGGAVLACSALKRRYRDVLRAADPALRFLCLLASADTLATRMQSRPGHFMPVSLLASQLRDFEPLQPDEPGLTVAATDPVDRILDRAILGP